LRVRRAPSRPVVAAGGVGRGARGARAFTLIEIMLAIAIFSMVLTAIYASWSSILRAARVGGDAAAEAQRVRLASRTIEDALISSVMFLGNPNRGLYAFEADTSTDFGALSFVARLPGSFPGSGFFGDQVVRRVTFSVEAGRDGVNQLMLRQRPLLQTNVLAEEEHAILLAREVSVFLLEFCQGRGNTVEWVPEWRATNQLPQQVRFALAFGHQRADPSRPKDVAVRTVSLPSVVVPPPLQMGAGAAAAGVAGPGAPGVPGAPAVGGDAAQVLDPNQVAAPGLPGAGGPVDRRRLLDRQLVPPSGALPGFRASPGSP